MSAFSLVEVQSRTPNTCERLFRLPYFELLACGAQEWDDEGVHVLQMVYIDKDKSCSENATGFFGA